MRGRYEVAGSALSTFADALEHAQTQAAAAISAHDDAQRRHTYAQRNLSDAHTAAHQTVDPTESQEATDAARRYPSMSTDGSSRSHQRPGIGTMPPVAAVAAGGRHGGRRDLHAVSSDGLNDSWWDTS